MANYPKREHSKRLIKDAGKRLREVLPYTEDVVETFRIAHNWRMAHAFPMLQERKTLSRICPDGSDTAGRIKRMDSIRKKLRRSSIDLHQMQDLAGIRAIVPNMKSVRRIEEWYLHGARAETILKVDDYICNPKAGGYRSLHLIRRYDGSAEDWHGMKVEIQVRTRLQHAWATAVEAIGAMRGEDIKAGEGDEKWRALLDIMSSFMAEKEKMPIGTDLPTSRRARRAMLEELDRELNAVRVLSAFRVVADQPTRDAKAYLIHLDADQGKVTVEAKRSYLDGGEGYFRQSDSGERQQSVLVSVDGIEALRRAYPNYFFDVGMFLDLLKWALQRY